MDYALKNDVKLSVLSNPPTCRQGHEAAGDRHLSNLLRGWHQAPRCAPQQALLRLNPLPLSSVSSQLLLSLGALIHLIWLVTKDDMNAVGSPKLPHSKFAHLSDEF